MTGCSPVRRRGRPPEWVQDARYKSNADRHANKNALLPLVADVAVAAPARNGSRRAGEGRRAVRRHDDLTHMRDDAQTAALGMVQRPAPEIDLGLMSLPLLWLRRSAPVDPFHGAGQLGSAQRNCWRALPAVKRAPGQQ